MDEYERLEPEMDELHAAYIERHRNLTYLESELEKIERDEEDAAAAHAAELDAMRGKLRAEELRRVLYLTLVPIRPRCVVHAVS